MTLDSQMYKEKKKDIAKANLIETLQKQVDEQAFYKKVTAWLFDYYGIVPKE